MESPEGPVGLFGHAGPHHLAGHVGAFGELCFGLDGALKGVGTLRSGLDDDAAALERPDSFD
jgi:hypothetical protein